jgi:hypothetical protein
MGYQVAEAPISWINRSFDMGHSSFRLVRVGGGYISVLWAVLRARAFGIGPYRALSTEQGSGQARSTATTT